MMRALNGCNHVQNSYDGCFHMIEDNTEWNLLTQTFLLFYNGFTECNNNTNFKFLNTIQVFPFDYAVRRPRKEQQYVYDEVLDEFNRV